MKRASLCVAFLLVIVTAAAAQAPEDKKAAIGYVQKLQQDGGFVAQVDAAKPSLRATSAAVRAIKYLGGQVKDKQAVAKFVDRCFDKTTGGFADVPGGKPDQFVTAVGLMAVVELKMPTEPYVEPAVKFLATQAKTFEDIRIAVAGLEAVGKRPPAADAWLEQVAKLRNQDGSVGKGPGAARATGSVVVAYLRLGGKLEQRDAVLKTLKSGQRSDGGFAKEETESSDLETSYRVMRAFHMLKEQPDAAKLRGFVAKCRNADGGYGMAPGQPSSVGATYFAAVIHHWLDEK